LHYYIPYLISREGKGLEKGGMDCCRRKLYILDKFSFSLIPPSSPKKGKGKVLSPYQYWCSGVAIGYVTYI
jgi:hypothetical protein